MSLVLDWICCQCYLLRTGPEVDTVLFAAVLFIEHLFTRPAFPNQEEILRFQWRNLWREIKSLAIGQQKQNPI